MIDLFWIGCDGSRWDLIRGPVVVTTAGLRGLMPGPTDRRTRESSQRDGQIRTGGRYLPRLPVLPVVLFQDGAPEGFWALYEAWSNSLSDRKTGQLVARNTDTGREATLNCAVDSWPDNPDVDPTTSRQIELVYGLVADDPFWYLPTVSMEFPQLVEQPEDYYGGGPVGDGQSGGGYPLVRGSGLQSGRVEMFNPGTEPAWWSARFPSSSSSFLVEVDGRRVSGSFAVPEGSTVEVDAQRSAVWLLTGPRREPLPWGRLDRVEFAPLPPGRAADVRIQSVGSGTPSFTFWPRRREAL